MKNEQLNLCRMFYLRYTQICATASHKLGEKQQNAGICKTASRILGEKQQYAKIDNAEILSTVSRKLGSAAGFGAVNGAVKTQSGAVNDTVNDTVKTPSGTLNDTLNGTLNGTLKGGQMSGQIGGQISGQIELTVSRLFYPKYSQIRETTSRILGEKQQYAKIDNAGICDSVNHKFETPPDIMKTRTRSYPNNDFHSLSKNNEKKFDSNQMKEMGL